MTANGWLQIAVYCLLVLAATKPLGAYMADVFEGRRTFLSPILDPVERGFYRLAGVDAAREQHWATYTIAMLLFNALGFLAVYALQRFQAVLPLNPAAMGAVAPDLAFNTAVSFSSNTNWQAYGGETTLSYLTQMAGLTTQNFVSAATGIALAIAFIRAFARASVTTLGNFWGDLTRCTLYILLPMAIVVAIALVATGVPQNSRRLCRRHDARGRQAADRRGAGRLADRHQAARHQWRRLLQRQLGASLRESDADQQPHRDVVYPRDLGRAHLHLRAHGARHAPGLDAVRRHGRDRARRHRRRLLG